MATSVSPEELVGYHIEILSEHALVKIGFLEVP